MSPTSAEPASSCSMVRVSEQVTIAILISMETPFGADVPVERVVWNMRNGQTSSFSKDEARPVRTRQTDYRTVPSGTS